MRIEKLSPETDIQKYLQHLGVDGGGIHILASKSKVHLIAIKDLAVGAANILKQDALSIGADLAVPRGTVIAKTPYVDTLLIASTQAIEILSRKELAQPFGLKEVAQQLKAYLKVQKPQKAEIMGVINANDDSFYSNSRFSGKNALGMIEKMLCDGADIIDVGGVSSRPNAAVVSAQEELQRVTPIIDLIAKEKLYEQVHFSIDSYEPEVISYALKKGFCIVNDITGLQNDAVCQLIGEYGARAVIMHMQGSPQTMQNDPYYEDVLATVYAFFQERIAKAERFGIEDIVLDIGIGFGKRLEDNMMLLKHLEHFLTLQKPLLVGASRKSMINKIFPSSVEDRLAGTLALHMKAFRNGASILRVHDVYEHAQALAVEEAFLAY